MSTYSASWDGSTLTLATTGLAPLTGLHEAVQPEEFDTTGSTDTAHSHGAGLPKRSYNIDVLGSLVPKAGTVFAVASTIKGAGASDYTDTMSNGIVSQCTVSGTKNGRIESSLTIAPGVSTLTPAGSSTATSGELGFNGSTFSFAGTALVGIQSINYSSTCALIDSTGAEAPTADTIYGAGIVDETITVTCIGGLQSIAAKAIGATVMAWNDSSSGLGSFTHAKCMSTNAGGQIDGQTTTVFVFKNVRSSATANN